MLAWGDGGGEGGFKLVNLSFFPCHIFGIASKCGIKLPQPVGGVSRIGDETPRDAQDCKQLSYHREWMRWGVVISRSMTGASGPMLNIRSRMLRPEVNP